VSTKPPPDLPRQCWHYAVRLKGEKARETAIVNDVSIEALWNDLVVPWCTGAPFTVAGTVVRSQDDVQHVQVVQTPNPLKHYADRHFARMNQAGIADLATRTATLAFGPGDDYTNRLLFQGPATAPAPYVAQLLDLCRRLPLAAKPMLNRRKGKTPFEITDEYDAQDLLHALVRGYFRYAVVEEPIGRKAGAHSTRADLAIEDLGVLIEVKFVHGPKDQNRIVEEFAEDIVFYSQWPHLQTFIYLVVNAADLSDPEALDKLEGPTEIGGKRYQTHIVRA